MRIVLSHPLPIANIMAEIVRQAFDGRIEVDSVSESEIEDADMSDISDLSSGTNQPPRPKMQLWTRDHYRPKRKFFRSSLNWDPINKELRTAIAGLNGYIPNGNLKPWG